MSFYNPYKKGPDWSQGLNDIVGKLMQMMMMKQLFGKDPQRQTQEMANTPMPQPRGQDPMSNPMQDIIGQAPSQMQPRQMPQQLMMALQNNPQLLQALMMMLNPGGAGGMMGPRRF